MFADLMDKEIQPKAIDVRHLAEISISETLKNEIQEMLEKEDVTFFHDLALAAEKAMSADAEKAMRVFAGL
jgi:hypothetical protein